MSVYVSEPIEPALIGVVPSPPEVVPRNTLYVTPPVGLAFQLNTTECVPVPDKVTVDGEFVALLAIVTLAPVIAPPDVGANVTVSGTDCPGPSTVPFAIPLAVNPVPVTVTLEIVTFAFPLLVTEVVCWLLL